MGESRTVWNKSAIQGIGSRLTPNRRFKLDKRSQYFIRTHNETLCVAAMCISNPDCAPIRIHC